MSFIVHKISVSDVVNMSPVRESEIERHLQEENILICSLLHGTIKIMHVMEHSNT